MDLPIARPTFPTMKINYWISLLSLALSTYAPAETTPSRAQWLQEATPSPH
ncbi:hypothetical protein [Rubritalea tangerina]|uniref:hypothetical protein n=1 Tax=Rubritalea tangerina TaxID=430798 RepID=UPI0036097209